LNIVAWPPDSPGGITVQPKHGDQTGQWHDGDQPPMEEIFLPTATSESMTIKLSSK